MNKGIFKIKNLTTLFLVPTLVTSLTILSCGTYVAIDKNESLSKYQSVLWQTTADRQAGLLTQFNNAKRQFDEVIKQKHLNLETVNAKEVNQKWEVNYHNNVPKDQFIPVVMMDLDETILDNTPNEVFKILNNQVHSSKQFSKWIKQKKAKIYDGALDFIKYVWSQNAMVFFSSNRPQGDKGENGVEDGLIPTRENLIEQNYPKAFLDSHVWWMKGSLQFEDKVQNKDSLSKMERKEQRFNYLNHVGTKIKTRTPEELGIKNVSDFNQTQFQNLPVQIVMRVGDDLNDFNDNLTKHGSPTIKNAYLNDKDIKALFGKVSPRISFKHVGNDVIKNYYEEIAEIDQSLKRKFVKEITRIDLNFEPKETYAFIAGNSMYGGWAEQYAQNINQIKESLNKYWTNFELS